MFCPFCGTELPDDSKFCSGCGSRVDLEDEVQMPDLSVMPEMPEDPNPRKSGKGKIIAVIAAAVVVLAAAGVGGYLVFNHMQEEKEEERLEAEEKESDDDGEAKTKKEKARESDDEDADKKDAEDKKKDSDDNDADDTKNEKEIVVEEKYDSKEGGIHRYEYIVSDVTWEQAYADCKSRGGYLVHINSREEYDYILNEINQRQLGKVQFFLGGRRASGSQEYYWIDEDGKAYGDQINTSGYWCSAEWLPGEPSYMDGSIEEMYLDILYHESSGKWVWNDAPNDILSIVPSFSGKIGYICEYED